MSEFFGWLLRALVIDVFVSLGTRVFNRRRNGPKANTVAYGWGMMTFGAVFTVLFGVPSILLLFAASLPGVDRTALFSGLLFGCIALPGVITFIDGLYRRIEWSETHVTLRTWRGTRQVKWREIGALDYKSRLKYWRIALPGGKGFAFQMSMGGAHAFIDSAIRRKVQIMEDGRPTDRMPDYN